MRKNYQKPTSEIIRVENEGVMALSDFNEGGGAMPNTTTRSGGTNSNTGSIQELEDMINDILTTK